ncbi:hypothetical protein Tco_0213835 [Tanacetum coccineum]
MTRPRTLIVLKADADQKRRQVDFEVGDFEVGDFVWAILTKDRFPVGEYNKLSAKKIGPLEIVEKINSNAYRLKLPSHIRCSDVFNVKHLLPYHGDSSDDDPVVNSRTNFVYPGENDAGPSIEERAILFLEARDRVKKGLLFKRPKTSRFEAWNEEIAVAQDQPFRSLERGDRRESTDPISLSLYYSLHHYTSASLDYFPASPGNTSPNPSDDLSKYLFASLAISPFHDDPYMKVMQAYDATNDESPILLPQAPIAPPTVNF